MGLVMAVIDVEGTLTCPGRYVFIAVQGALFGKVIDGLKTISYRP